MVIYRSALIDKPSRKVNQTIREIEAETFAALRQRYAPPVTLQLAVLLAGGVAAAAFVLALPAIAWVLL